MYGISFHASSMKTNTSEHVPGCRRNKITRFSRYPSCINVVRVHLQTSLSTSRKPSCKYSLIVIPQTFRVTCSFSHEILSNSYIFDQYRKIHFWSRIEGEKNASSGSYHVLFKLVRWQLTSWWNFIAGSFFFLFFCFRIIYPTVIFGKTF